ncbi:YMGG-like glycine zipper-containing protein [Geomesophilobacter sediminis]|uniref:Glycine zipper family protein n=1 Tax=Geomesophilobacter sediminis TaxID=2798584 RepID=A0A8J7IPP4_9BACT|nr:YMGG-like glycine zipper-containing protein [Geomesophilobacter sediminis]MBJ6724414.1 glycine zipper family protein [Geomesophilobacter sediminis]
MMRIIPAFLLVMLVAGCETLPTGPSVLVLPSRGKPFDQFQREDAACRQWAGERLGNSPQQAADQNVARGAVTGTAVGAGIGALLGAASGHPGAGAAFGAGSGLLVGSVAGADSGHYSGREAQRRYDNTYLQCMYAYGNQIPGTMRSRRPVRSDSYYPPPPPESDMYPPPNEPPPR